MQTCIRGKCWMFVFKNCIIGIKNMGIILSESIDFMFSNDIQIVNKILHLIASQIGIPF